ncbi:hypothetical protein CHLRE_09g397900v5 [Chlamydomonas reinhardtii]|uniref:Cleft lip and palate associated transmembrane protein n=1 Tax=Chlamydomonas reinhardtii TaxID=3055 RepID=A0A2K3DD23_CHLRE|nr:uncharacterized protein CHLRE_09g397900v5 [Chlamydomonas reinhardtii]PNW78427.1 hypothetical protein CHLRE_09g397900v5 [Chlamydomonas reinhardtii]
MPGEVAAAAAAGAAGAAGAGAEGGQPGQQRQQGGFGQLLGMVVRMGVMWYFMNMMKGQKTPPPAGGAGSPAAAGAGAGGAADLSGYLYPVFPKGQLVDMYMFLSEQRSYPSHQYAMEDLIWSETGVELGGAAENRKLTYTYELSEAVKNNGSVWLHMVLARAGDPVAPDDPAYDPSAVAYYTYQLNAYRPKPRNNTGVNLLSENPVDVPKVDPKEPREIMNFIRPNITLQLVDHFQAYNRKAVPPQILDAMRFNPATGHYLPLVFFNDFWLLKDKLVPVNETLDRVDVHMELSYVSMVWWQLLGQMDQSFNMQVKMGMSQDGESDEIKRIFLEGNPYLLGLTFVVSMLHTVFDLLAFKNDIGFWKNNKSMEGLSARTVLINAFCQVVILLYLFDNDTSFVVLLSSVLGTGIELWKVTKAFDVSFNRERFPYISLKDRATYSNKQTKQYDADAMRYLSYALYPLVIGYSIYALMYKTHKSWYSWILSSLVGAVYMFGFILMCPQLYLNYKLKSVAHLPWRQMTYKFLNTIIDDLFAFVIKMPLLHRLSVFRDDVVFLIYLYQRWVYRVDKTRANEFGWAEEHAEPQPEEPAAAITQGEGSDTVAAVASDSTAAAGSDAAGEGGARRRKGGKSDKEKEQEEDSKQDSSDGKGGKKGK